MSIRVLFFRVVFCLVFVSFLTSCGSDLVLRPTFKTLQHDADREFIGRDGIKELCEKYLGMRYLDESEIEEEKLKNRTKADLNNPDIYKSNEDRYGKQVQDGYLADIYVKFINDTMGYGVFANSPIKSGELIGEYTGVIRNSSNSKDGAWSWSYPNEIYKKDLHIPIISVDGKYAGNGLRFVNHSDTPNTTMYRIFLNGYVRTLYIANRDIAKGEQITISYGAAYWSGSRKKIDI